MLLRDGHVVGELQCPPSLPFGVQGAACQLVATDQLQPGDQVLFYTDGVIEGRNENGEEFGEDRLADMLARESRAGWAPEEVLRRRTQAVMSWQEGKLRDDATLVLLHWAGPAG